MEEALKKITRNIVEPTEKKVILSVGSQFFHLNGIWSWELNSAIIYCSDVMCFPQDVVAAKAIVHPDDLPKLMAALTMMKEKEIPGLDFRIITTYGEVKIISGQRVSVESPKKQLNEPVPGKEMWQEALEQIALQKENDFLQLRKELAEFSERMNHAGSWLMNKNTGEVWYSDNVFRLYDLAPQSLNAHANTFNSFIHPEDRMAVEDAFEKAYALELPLHIEYRIVLFGGRVEYLQQITKWIHNYKGHALFCGMVRNVSGERAVADELFAAQSQTNFYQQVINFSERQSATGYWHINLITKKTSFSENYSRLYGMKHSWIPNYNAFLNLVHAEDRSKVSNLIDTMYREHVLPDAEFRIVRPDGKIRVLKQSGKLHINANKEFTMIGVVQDITVQKTLEKKIKELNETVALNKIATKMGEQFAAISFITWLPDGYMQWSDGFYHLLGYKTASVEPLPKILYKSIHPSDLKLFKDAEALILNNQEHEPINIRIVPKSGIRNLQISFRRLEPGKEHTVALVQDLTATLALQKEYSENKLLVQLMADAVKDIVFFTNTDHIITTWNKEAEKKTGIPKEEAIQYNLFDVFPKLNEEKYLIQLNAANKGVFTPTLRSAGGYIRQPYDYWLCPLKNENEEITGVLHVVHDVSEQLLVHQQLSERLNFIESLLQSSVDRIVVLDRLMNYMYWNPMAEQYYGIKKERIIGKNILEIFPSFRNHPGYNEFRKVLKGETVHLPASPNEETEEYSETYLIPVKEESGNVTAVLWIVHDLSKEYEMQREKREADEKIKKQAHYLQRITEATPDMLSIMELQTRKFTFLNAEMFTAQGFDANKLSENSFAENNMLVHPDDRAAVEDYFQKFANASDNDVLSVEYRAQSAHGGWNWYLVRGRIFEKDEEGKATHILNAVENITERKKAEQQVLQLKDALAQKATDKYLTLFNSVDEGFCIIELLFDAEDRPYDYRVLEANPAFEQQTGLQSAVGKAASELIPSLEQHWFDRFGEVAKTGTSSHFEYGVEATGRYFEVNAFRTGAPHKAQVGVLFRDISERKKHEEQQQYLVKIGDAIRSIENAVTIEEEVTKIALDYFAADRCYYTTIDGENAIVKRDARRGDLPSVSGTYPVSAFAMLKTVYDTGKPYIVDDVRMADTPDKEFKELAIQLNIISFISMPVIKEGNTLGILNIVQTKARHWTNAEVKLIAETAERIWSAVERANAEEALKKSEEKYRTIFTNIDEGFVISELLYDESGKAFDLRVIETNQRFNEMMQVTNAIGKTAKEIFPHAEDSWFEMYHEVIATGKAIRFENYLKELDSWFGLYISRIGDEGSRTVAIVFNDITESKDRNKALKNLVQQRTSQLEESKYLLQNIINAPNIGLAVYKAVRDRKGKIVDFIHEFINKRTIAALEKDMTGKLLTDHGKDGAEQLPAFIETIETGKANNYIRHTQFGGEEHWILFSNAPLDSERMVHVWEDITELKKTELELEKQLTLLKYTEYLAQSGSWDYEIANAKFTWSEGMYKLFGLPQQMNVRPEVYLDYAVKEDRRIAKRIVSNFKRHHPFEEVMRIQQNGNVRTLKINTKVKI